MQKMTDKLSYTILTIIHWFSSKYQNSENSYQKMLLLSCYQPCSQFYSLSSLASRLKRVQHRRLTGFCQHLRTSNFPRSHAGSGFSIPVTEGSATRPMFLQYASYQKVMSKKIFVFFVPLWFFIALFGNLHCKSSHVEFLAICRLKFLIFV